MIMFIVIHLVKAETCRHLIFLLTVRVEFRVVQLSVAELGKDLLPEASSTLCHAWEHATTLVSKVAGSHKSWVLDRTESLIWRTHLLIHVWTWHTFIILVHSRLIVWVHRVIRIHFTHATTETLESVMAILCLRVSSREESIITEFLSQILHILIIVELTWLNILVLLVFLGLHSTSVILRLLWWKVSVPIQKFSTWTQGS